MSPPKLSTLTVTLEVSPGALSKLKSAFSKVNYHPDGNVPASALSESEVWFSKWSGIPDGVKVEDVPELKIVQLTSAGANAALKNPLFKDPRALKQISICSASGIHVLSIPQYILAQVINLYMNMHTSIYLCRSRKSWPAKSELSWDPIESGSNAGFLSLRGKTAGLLGYGHIGRETARLLKAFNVDVIVANSNGERREDDGYILPGTGDKDGSIPSAYYSTNDKASFDEFLSRSDILIASLPSTPQTHYMLDTEHLKKLPKGSVFVNVGRGDLIRSEDLITALDDHALLGAALDVTDPEPLPKDHPLFSHPRVIITPHVSGDFVGYFDAAADLLVANVENVRKGGKAYNVVDPKKGY